MDTEGSERPAISNQATTEGPAAGVKGSLNNQTNGSAKPGLKLPKAGIKGNRQPISSRPASTPHSRMLSGSKKSTEQRQRISSTQPSPGSCTSSHAKIMEKKLAAKAVKEHVSGPRTGNTNSDSISSMGKAGGPSKGRLPVPNAAAQGKNLTPLRPSSTVSKKPVAAVAKVPVSRPERPLQSKPVRPDATTSSNLTQSTGTLRRQPVPVSTGAPRNQPLPRVPRDRSHPAQSGVLSTKPQTGKPVTSLNKDVKSATSLTTRSSSELNKVTRAAKSTKPMSAKPSEAEGKTLNARVKGQLPKVSTRSTARPQPGNATSKMSAANVPKQSTKHLKRNVEKQSLPNKTLSSSARKPISENYVDEETRAVGLAEALLKMPTEVESAVVTEEMSAIFPSEDVAVTPQGHLKIEEFPSPQRMQLIPCLSNAEMILISAEEEKTEDEKVEANSWMRANTAAEGEKEDSTEAIIDLDEGNKGLSDQMTEADLNFHPKNEEQNLGTPDSFKMPVKVDLSKTEAEQFNDEANTPINGKTDLNDLQVQHLLPESGSPTSGKGMFQSSTEDGSPIEAGSTNVNGSATPVPMRQDLAPRAGPPSECCLDSSPEMDSPLSNVEKVKLGLYEYSEEADTEESQNELCPEAVQSEDNEDHVFESPSLLETRQVESSVLLLEQKLGISSEESHEDQGVSKSSTLSGPDLAGKSSSTTSTPEELKDYDSSSGVELKSEKLEAGDLCVPQTILSPVDDLDQDLGIHLERVDEEPDTLAADDLHGERSTEPLVSSEEEDHLEADCETVNESGQSGLEGIDNPVFEDKTTMDSNLEALNHGASSGSFKHLTLHAVDESEELATAEAPHSLVSQNCMQLAVGSSPEASPCGQRAGLEMDHQSCGAKVSFSLENSLPPNVGDAIVPEVTFSPVKDSALAETTELESDQSKSCDVEEPVSRYPIDHLEGAINVQKLSTPTTDANGNHMLHQQQYYSACEKNDRLLTGLLGDQTPLQPHAGVPWISPPLPPILSTIYEVETAEETRLDDDLEEESQKPTDWRHPELIEEPSERVLTLQIEPVKVVQQLINQTLLLSGDGMKLQSKVTVDQAELSKWTGLISPLDDSTASITSVTSFSPEDISSSQGEWTVVELETHH